MSLTATSVLSVYTGTVVTSTVTFYAAGTTTATDPSTVTLKYRVSTGSVTTWVYLGAGSVTRVATGIYSAELDTTNLPGLWGVEWIGTGSCAAVAVALFTATPQPW